MSRLGHVHSSANDASNPESPSEQKVNWGILLIFTVLGLVALFGGWLVAYEVTALRDEHAAYWSGLLVNVGTTLLLTAALVWFERVVLRRVRTENVRAVKEAADQAADAAAERIVPRVEELERSIEASASALKSNRAESAEQVASQPTFESVETALERAAEINAVRMRTFPGSSERIASIIVPAGAAPEAPRLGVMRVPRMGPRPARIILTFDGSEVVWQEGMATRDAFVDLHEKMTAAGHGVAAGNVSVTSFFENCSLLLRLAIAARQNDAGRWLSGSPAIELIAADWVVTEAGIEVKGSGVVAAKDAFGRYLGGSNRVTGYVVPPSPPGGLDEDLWTLARTRASALLRGSPFPHLSYQQPPPFWMTWP